MEKKIKTIIYVVIALGLAYETYRLSVIEQKIEKLEKENKIECLKQ